MWIILAILSALCLGCYDVSKKRSLDGNSVTGVLLLSVLCSSCLLLPFVVLSRLGILSPDSLCYVAEVSARDHLFILLKSCLVLASWVCAYMAVKHLPLTLVAPVNATRPMWTLLGALLLFGERLDAWQWVGVTLVLAAFFAFSFIGHKEGFHIRNNAYMAALLLGTLLGAASGLYDKYLMRHIDHNAVQAYYTFYQALLMLPVYLFSTRDIRRAARSGASSVSLDAPSPASAARAGVFHEHVPLRWRYSILGISLFLVLSDFFHLLALTDPDSLIAVISTTRRCGVVIPFVYGAIVLHDRHIRLKSLCLLFVLAGMLCLLLGTLL